MLREGCDVYGNVRNFFSLHTPHQELRVRAQSQVRTSYAELPQSTLGWEDQCERFRYQAGAAYDAAAEFVFPSPYVPRHADFANYARPSFPAGVGLLEGVTDLTQRMHREFRYASQSTQITTPAREALAQRTGVCQDFAHIMLACLRMLGVPARYVSGYLQTQAAAGSPKLVGRDASHAWVSVYLADFPDEQRWCDFDPTNNRWGWHAPGMDYVTLAVGRDFGDVSPLRGVIHGGSNHTLAVAVTVLEMSQPAATREFNSSNRQEQA
jgi:transglutaminase-like putative cysteine protease